MITFLNNTIRYKKLATIFSGQKNVTQPFVRQKQIKRSVEIYQQLFYLFYFRTLLNKAILISESQSSFTESIFSYSDFFFNYSQFVLNNFLICSVQKLSFQQETKRVSCTHLHYLIINSRVVSSRLLTSQIISFYVIVWALLFTRGIFTWVQT